MKKFLLVFASLFVLSLQAKAEGFLSGLNSIEQKNIIASVMNELNAEGQFGNADATTLQMAGNLVQSIVSDPQLLQSFENGDLVLDEQFVADYFFKDTLGSIGGAISGAASTLLKFVSPVFNSVKDAAAFIVSVANRTLSYITDSRIIMETIKAGIKVTSILLPFGVTAGATALAGLFFPPASVPIAVGVLVPILGVATTVFAETVKAEYVIAGIKMLKAGTELMDTVLNPPKKADEAPSMLAIEQKNKPASKKQIGEALLLSLKMGKVVEDYLNKIGESGWKKLSTQEKKLFTGFLNRKNKLAASIRIDKL